MTLWTGMCRGVSTLFEMTLWTDMCRGFSTLFEWLGFRHRRLAAESDVVVPWTESHSDPTGPQNPRKRHVHFVVPLEV